MRLCARKNCQVGIWVSTQSCSYRWLFSLVALPCVAVWDCSIFLQVKLAHGDCILNVINIFSESKWNVFEHLLYCGKWTGHVETKQLAQRNFISIFYIELSHYIVQVVMILLPVCVMLAHKGFLKKYSTWMARTTTWQKKVGGGRTITLYLDVRSRFANTHPALE